ncbi:MAG: beta-ketoacyl synthase N-terminal-like domain-containing protein, partial [Pseudomonadota bacterium]
MSKRRVVVTGMGLLSPIGNSLESAWANALAGKSGANAIEGFETEDYSVKIC